MTNDLYRIKQLSLLIAFLFSANQLMAQYGIIKHDDVLPVQEKVYLHFDNNCYFQGDTIWYKAYVVLADDNSPEPLSRILYVELLDQQGYVQKRQQLVVDREGHANGQFALPDTCFSGYYEVRAYTKWMLNFGYDLTSSWRTGLWSTPQGEMGRAPHSRAHYEENEIKANDGRVTNTFRLEDGNTVTINGVKNGTLISTEFSDQEWETISMDRDGMRKNYRDYGNLFSRVLPVYNRPDSIEHYMRKVMPTKITMGDYEIQWKTPDFDAKFYPEGGQLLEGAECRVAWEAMNQELERLNVSGALLEDGELLDSIHPLHAGRGAFAFTPQHGKKYTVRFEFQDHKFKFDLPKPLKEGAHLTVSQDDEAVYFDVDQRFEEIERPELILNVFCRGKRIKTIKVDKADHWTDGLYLDDLPEGVNQAVLIDNESHVYADRLFFVNKTYESQGKIMIAGVANRAYTPFEKIRLNLLATDSKGRPLKEQNISVSVRDHDQLDPTFTTGNIMTNLLLESEIKGFVENPDYYFESNDEKHREALDQLLMVQGWRRYNWQDVMMPRAAQIDYLPEQKMVIYGEAITLRKKLFTKDLGKLQIACNLFSLSNELKEGDTYLFRGVVEADTSGHFQIAYDPFYGKVRLSLRAKFVRKLEKKGYEKVEHDKEIFLRKQYFYPGGLRAYSWYETNQPNMTKEKKLTWEEFQKDIYATEWIPEVKIKAKKRPHALRQKDKHVFSMSWLDYINDQFDQGFYDVGALYDVQEPEFNPDISTLSWFVRHQYKTSTNNYESHMPAVNWSFIDMTPPDTPTQWDLNNYQPVLDSIFIVSDAPRRPTDYELHHLDRIGGAGGYTHGVDTYYNVTTRPEGDKRTVIGREYDLEGFTRPAEFYCPDYSKAALPEIKDYRRTLYWNPNLTTDNAGQATIEFYNTKACTILDIDATGISRHGEFLITTDE